MNLSPGLKSYIYRKQIGVPPLDELKALVEASLILPDYKNHPRVTAFEEVLDLLKKSLKC